MESGPGGFWNTEIGGVKVGLNGGGMCWCLGHKPKKGGITRNDLSSRSKNQIVVDFREDGVEHNFHLQRRNWKSGRNSVDGLGCNCVDSAC